MAKDKPIQAFNCPNCGAPLIPEAGASTMQCKYCESTVVIPKSGRTRATRTNQRTLTAGALTGLTGSSLFSILNRGSWILYAISMTGLLVVGCLVLVFFSILSLFQKDDKFTSVKTAIPPHGFATQVLTFGSQGIGPGMFSDARSVAVMKNGNIVVGDYNDGRVQTFDPAGRFLSVFSTASETTVRAVAASADGSLYVAYNSSILIFDSAGKKTSSIDLTDGVAAMTIGADGKIYVITDYDELKRFDASGKLEVTIPKAFQSELGQGESSPSIALDGLGNIYIVGDIYCVVVKYSPSGKYLNQFGGKAKSTGAFISGTLFQPVGIVVDGYGRVFIADWNSDIQIFDTKGLFLKSIDADTLGFKTLIYGMNIDSQNNIYLAEGDKVEKWQIEKPPSQ